MRSEENTFCLKAFSVVTCNRSICTETLLSYKVICQNMCSEIMWEWKLNKPFTFLKHWNSLWKKLLLPLQYVTLTTHIPSRVWLCMYAWSVWICGHWALATWRCSVWYIYYSLSTGKDHESVASIGTSQPSSCTCHNDIVGLTGNM